MTRSGAPGPTHFSAGFALGIAFALAAPSAVAQPRSAGGAEARGGVKNGGAKNKDGAKDKDPKDDGATAKAQQHFQRARELYQQGSYREAITELEAAHQLDPNAKDLVFNLAVVNEKLGKIDEALSYMRQYAQMDLDANERARADAAIRRLEGAKRELAPPPSAAPSTTAPEAPPATSGPPASSSPAPTSPPPVAPESHGKMDAFTVTAGVLALAGVAVGTTFGLKAMHDRPSSGFVTGRDGAYADLQSRATHAHQEAQIADAGFAVAAAAALTATILYFARTSTPSTETVGARAPASPSPVSLDVGRMRITW